MLAGRLRRPCVDVSTELAMLMMLGRPRDFDMRAFGFDFAFPFAFALAADVFVGALLAAFLKCNVLRAWLESVLLMESNLLAAIVVSVDGTLG